MANEQQATKHQQAIAKATGGTGGDPVAMTIATDTSTVMRPFDPEAARAMLASGKYEMAPEILKWPSPLPATGASFRGVLEGHGPPAELTDTVTGEYKEVPTWIFRDPTGAIRWSIISSTQLDKKLVGFIGDEVLVVRYPDVNIGGGKRMTPYNVIGPKLPNGKLRRWFELPADAPQPMLAAGEQNGSTERTAS